MQTREFLNLVYEEIKDYDGIADCRKNDLEVIQVWYSKTIQNHKGLFIVRNKLDDNIYNLYVEATYNGDINHLYLDFYEKIEKVTLDLDLFDLQ